MMLLKKSGCEPGIDKTDHEIAIRAQEFQPLRAIWLRGVEDAYRGSTVAPIKASSIEAAA